MASEPFDVNARTDVDARSLRDSLLHHLHFSLAKDRFSATRHDYYLALVYAVRERLIARWLQTQQRYYRDDCKRVYYLSMEYLTGRTLANALVNLGLLEECRSGLSEIGLDLDDLILAEWEAGLGNGGLGRLAACLLDSLATLALPAYGYGIRFEFGIFQQKIEYGQQVEVPDNWLRFGNPWEIVRPEDYYLVKFGGHVRQITDRNGRLQFEWVTDDDVMAMAYDTPVPGYENDTVNTLRLWSAESSHGFNLAEFNRGDYVAAVEDKSRSKSISRVLYPDDNVSSGKELRLKQEHFFVSASLQDIVRRYKKTHPSFDQFTDKVAIQLNDTHPALAIPEMMRILMDLEQLDWDTAWNITVGTFGYTNHTLLPEALEEWTFDLLERVLPRHLQIICEINYRFLKDVEHQHPGDFDLLRRLSMIAEDDVRRVRMSHLAIVGSHRVNGVSQLHSELLQTHMFPEFHELYPTKFCATTNGITPRRWLKMANPRLSELITETLGEGWLKNFDRLQELIPHAERPEFRDQWAAVKQWNKARLAATIQEQLGLTVDIDSLFDCQVKRIHEYKRQLMNVLHCITLYNRIRDGKLPDCPRTVIIAGKAAPGYAIAKSIIQLIHAVADVINHDPRVQDWLKIAFLPNYNVTLAEQIIPAMDLSEQISTAGTEASGTGNMKAMLNGALTIGTLDGANIEILEAVGKENIFIFGRDAEDVRRTLEAGYDPHAVYAANADLRRCIDMIRDGFFSSADPTAFDSLLSHLFETGDRYLVLDEFSDFVSCQNRVSSEFTDQDCWTSKSILNTAQATRFSSDCTVLTYARDIWGLDA
jgi:starch phosphorylase